MNRARVRGYLLVAFLTLILIWAVGKLVTMDEEDKVYHVSVISKDTDRDYFKVIEEGMNNAGSECRIVLNYVVQEDMNDIELLIENVSNERNDGADGIIIETLPTDVSEDDLISIRKMCPVVVLEEVKVEDSNIRMVSPMYKDMGENLVSQIMVDAIYGERTSRGLRIGVLYGSSNRYSTELALAGIYGKANKEGLKVEWKIEGGNEDAEEVFAKLRMAEPVDILIGLGYEETEELLDYTSLASGRSTKADVYGVGFSEKLIHAVDNDELKALCVPNEFHLGYEAVSSMSNILRGILEADKKDIAYLLVRKDNLYDAENEKLLFPIIE